MSPVTEELVLKALGQVIDPRLSRDIVSLNQVKNLKIDGNKVAFQIDLKAADADLQKTIGARAKEALQLVIPDVEDIQISFSGQQAEEKPGETDTLLPGVKNIIAVSSGKGGVGKTTVSVNLAVALAQSGAQVGLVDADIYGPNVPLMMGLKTPPASVEGKITPAENHGVRYISMAFFVPEDTPMIWRGPMVHGAIQQLLRDVAWGELDFMLVDLPPGTGDAQLSIAQLVPLTGAVIVTTPQEVALLDSKKGLSMFKKVSVPLLGIIENMSFFSCPHCHEQTEIFSRGGGRAAAEKLGVSFLGEVPIDPAIRLGGDTGAPIVSAEPESPQAAAFVEISQKLAEEVSQKNAERTSLKIIQ
ncbi:MAG: Mrp/NBP35 family ATP-binding protein [Nitrospiria bacterium]